MSEKILKMSAVEATPLLGWWRPCKEPGLGLSGQIALSRADLMRR